jgi:hypothetical protein
MTATFGRGFAQCRSVARDFFGGRRHSVMLSEASLQRQLTLATARSLLVGFRAMQRIALLLLAFLVTTGHAWAASYLVPPEGVDIIGEVKRIRAVYEDTFVELARRYDVGYEELVRANPAVDPWLPGEGVEILLPTRFVLPNAPRTGIVLNIPEMRLYYYPTPRASVGRGCRRRSASRR